jgi:hypothetical protein
MPTRRIASPNQLATELHRIIAYCETGNPSREKLADELLSLAGDTVGMEFPSMDSLKKYLHLHPKADPSKHTVEKEEDPEAENERIKKDYEEYKKKGEPSLSGTDLTSPLEQSDGGSRRDDASPSMSMPAMASQSLHRFWA